MSEPQEGMDAELRGIEEAAHELAAVAERFSTIPLELQARGLEKDVPIPAGVFMDVITRQAHLMSAFLDIQGRLTRLYLANFRELGGAVGRADARLHDLQAGFSHVAQLLQKHQGELAETSRLLREIARALPPST